MRHEREKESGKSVHFVWGWGNQNWLGEMSLCFKASGGDKTGLGDDSQKPVS